MFDPTQPADHSALSSAVMRSQLTGLKALIDAILTVDAAQVDTTSTLPAGQPATASITVVGNTLHFSFGIPEGLPGPPGPPGEVTQAALDAAISTTAINPSGVSPLSQSADINYNSVQMQLVMDKVDELLNALRRF